MSEDDTDEAVDRLGGPSKISKLAERVERLEQLLAEKTDAIEALTLRNAVRVGEGLEPSMSPLCWYGKDGTWTSPAGSHRIEGIGHDWVVVRDITTNDLRWSVDTEIIQSLADCIK